MDDPKEEPAIPILKEEERERKGGAVVVHGSKAGVEGAWPAWLGALLAKAPWAALALGVGGAGLVGYGLLRERNAPAEESAAALEGPRAIIAPRARDSQGSRSLNFASESSKGQLNWEGLPGPSARQAAEGNPAEPGPPGVARPAAAGAPAQFPSTRRPAGRLANDLSGARLTSRMEPSRFGANDIFSKGSRGFGQFQRPALKALSQNAAPAAGSALASSSVSSSRAMAQLKFSRERSQEGARSGAAEGGASMSAQAFDQRLEGGRLAAPPSDDGSALGSVVQPPGQGAPSSEGAAPVSEACPGGWNQAPGGGCQPPDAVGANVTPYQGLVDEALQLRELSRDLLLAGAALLALAALLLATGVNAVVAAVIAGIGAALLVTSQSLGAMEQQVGKTVGVGYGQQAQGRIIDGKPDGGAASPQNPFHGAAQEERDATFHP